MQILHFHVLVGKDALKTSNIFVFFNLHFIYIPNTGLCNIQYLYQKKRKHQIKYLYI